MQGAGEFLSSDNIGFSPAIGVRKESRTFVGEAFLSEDACKLLIPLYDQSNQIF
jgi:hypothetical protein